MIWGLLPQIEKKLTWGLEAQACRFHRFSPLHGTNGRGSSSNPRPHQKKGVRKLSELVKQSLLPRQRQTLNAGIKGVSRPFGDFGLSRYPAWYPVTTLRRPNPHSPTVGVPPQIAQMEPAQGLQSHVRKR